MLYEASLDSLLTNGVGELHWMQPLQQTNQEAAEIEELYEDEESSSDEEEDDPRKLFSS